MAEAFIRLGLVGVGRWGSRYLDTLRQMAGIELACIATNRTYEPPSGCRVVWQWRELVADPSLDGVIVATPPAVHAEIAQTALAAGRAVLVEKPVTLDSASALAVLESARRADRPVLVGHIDLFHPAYRELKKRAGVVTSLRGEWSGPGPVRPDVSTLWDYGPHAIGACLDLLGSSPTKVTARRVQRQATVDGWAELVALGLEHPGDVQAELLVGNAATSRTRRLEAKADGTTWTYDDDAASKLSAQQGSGPAAAIPVSETAPLTQLVADFAEAIGRGGFEPAILELAVEVVAVLERCQTALELCSDSVPE